MTPDMIKELQTISPQHVDNLVGNVLAELDKLKQQIQAKDRTRPDADLLIQKAAPFRYLEFLAIACFRLRGKWKRASEAQRTLEQRRGEWNTVISAALVHARNDIAGLEKGSDAYGEQIDRILALVDLLSMTFRPLNGPNAGWIAVTAATVGAGTQ
jgi:hypothetical protein